VIVTEQETHGGDYREHESRPTARTIGKPPQRRNRRGIDDDLGIVVEPRQQEDVDGGCERTGHDRPARPHGEQERRCGAGSEDGDAENQLRQRAAAEERLHRGSDVVVQRRAVIDEVADRKLAKQDLPASNQVEEVIVGQPRERSARIVETEKPREHEDRK
jgi:hypothetical protein